MAVGAVKIMHFSPRSPAAPLPGLKCKTRPDIVLNALILFCCVNGEHIDEWFRGRERNDRDQRSAAEAMNSIRSLEFSGLSRKAAASDDLAAASVRLSANPMVTNNACLSTKLKFACRQRFDAIGSIKSFPVLTPLGQSVAIARWVRTPRLLEDGWQV